MQKFEKTRTPGSRKTRVSYLFSLLLTKSQKNCNKKIKQRLHSSVNTYHKTGANYLFNLCAIAAIFAGLLFFSFKLFELEMSGKNVLYAKLFLKHEMFLIWKVCNKYLA